MKSSTLLLVLVGLPLTSEAAFLGTARSVGAEPSSCGGAPSYPNAKPKNFADARKTKYDPETKKTVKVQFVAGDTVAMECEPGFTTDGSKDGSTEFDADCAEHGYFKPKGVCMKASKCGEVPKIEFATPTGKVEKGTVQFACNQGYSLDGEKVIPGGHAKNQDFGIKCVEFSGAYEKFTGKCEAYAFVPSGETTRIYNQVFDALFTVSCKGTVVKAFGKGEPPAGLDAACDGLGESKGDCSALVSTIKSDFDAQLQARKDHDSAAKDEGKDWFEPHDAERPGIGDKAKKFCTDLWKLLEFTPSSK